MSLLSSHCLDQQALFFAFLSLQIVEPRYTNSNQKEAAGRKRRKYEYLGQRLQFVPLAVETAGVWDPAGLRFLREVGVRVAAVTGEKRAPAFFLQRLSLAVQRGNVAAVLGTLPKGVRFEEIFLL